MNVVVASGGQWTHINLLEPCSDRRPLILHYQTIWLLLLCTTSWVDKRQGDNLSLTLTPLMTNDINKWMRAKREPFVRVVQELLLNDRICTWPTGRPITLIQTSHWHQNKSCVLVWGTYTESVNFLGSEVDCAQPMPWPREKNLEPPENWRTQYRATIHLGANLLLTLMWKLRFSF